MYAPIDIPLVPRVTVTLTPTAQGGDGGDYGYPGTTGFIFACAQVLADVPLFGTITIPLGCYPSGGVSFQPGGQPGHAVRRLGGAPLFPYPDAPYLTNFIKGRIGP